MVDGREPVPRSVAGKGDVAAKPQDADDITTVTVRDDLNNPVGFLIQWQDDEWIWAESGSYEPLAE